MLEGIRYLLSNDKFMRMFQFIDSIRCVCWRFFLSIFRNVRQMTVLQLKPEYSN